MTIQLFKQFDAAQQDLTIANDDVAAEAAMERRNTAADAIMYDPNIKLELRLAVAIQHCEDLCHDSTMDVMRKVLAA